MSRGKKIKREREREKKKSEIKTDFVPLWVQATDKNAPGVTCFR